MENHAEQTTLPTSGWSRRRFLQAGAVTAVGAAALAACSTKDNPTARIGTVPSTTALPEEPVTDIVLVRTATSLEHLLVSVYGTVASQNMLSGAEASIAAKMHDEHEANAQTLADLTVEAGGEAFECPNERMMAVYIEPAMQLILGSKVAAEALGIEAPEAEIPPSPDPAHDTLVLLNALEVIAAATHHAYVKPMNSIELRAAGMQIGVGSSRRGALWGALLNPDELVQADVAAAAAPVPETTAEGSEDSAADVNATTTTSAAPAEEATPVAVVHAVSATFGQLGPQLIELGAQDENGIRKKVNLETPFINSLAYVYQGSGSCEA